MAKASIFFVAGDIREEFLPEVSANDRCEYSAKKRRFESQRCQPVTGATKSSEAPHVIYGVIIKRNENFYRRLPSQPR